MLRSLAGGCARLLQSGGARTPQPLGAAAHPSQPVPGALFALQVRYKKPAVWRSPKMNRPGRPHGAGKKNGTWWQPLLPALAAERCSFISGQGSNDAKRNQIRHQQSLWDVAKRKESERRSHIYTQLKLDAVTDRVRAVYASYADLLREHPDGIKPSPSARERKLASRRAAADVAKAAPAAAAAAAPAEGAS